MDGKMPPTMEIMPKQTFVIKTRDGKYAKFQMLNFYGPDNEDYYSRFVYQYIESGTEFPSLLDYADDSFKVIPDVNPEDVYLNLRTGTRTPIARGGDAPADWTLKFSYREVGEEKTPVILINQDEIDGVSNLNMNIDRIVSVETLVYTDLSEIAGWFDGEGNAAANNSYAFRFADKTWGVFQVTGYDTDSSISLKFYYGADVKWFPVIEARDDDDSVIGEGYTYSFGNLNVNESNTVILKVFNRGNDLLNITDVQIEGGDSSSFSKTLSADSIAAGGSADLTLTFNAGTDPGYKNASVKITSDSKDNKTVIFNVSGKTIDSSYEVHDVKLYTRVEYTRKWMFGYYYIPHYIQSDDHLDIYVDLSSNTFIPVKYGDPAPADWDLVFTIHTIDTSMGPMGTHNLPYADIRLNDSAGVVYYLDEGEDIGNVSTVRGDSEFNGAGFTYYPHADRYDNSKLDKKADENNIYYPFMGFSWYEGRDMMNLEFSAYPQRVYVLKTPDGYAKFQINSYTQYIEDHRDGDWESWWGSCFNFEMQFHFQENLGSGRTFEK